MSVLPVTPTFGGKHQAADFYAAVHAVIAAMRSHSTLRTIANELNARGYATPSGLEWNRSRLANFIFTTTKQ